MMTATIELITTNDDGRLIRGHCPDEAAGLPCHAPAVIIDAMPDPDATDDAPPPTGPFFTNWGPLDGPILGPSPALSVLADRAAAELPIGIACPVGLVDHRRGPAKTSGRWLCVGREFIPLGEAAEELSLPRARPPGIRREYPAGGPLATLRSATPGPRTSPAQAAQRFCVGPGADHLGCGGRSAEVNVPGARSVSVLVGEILLKPSRELASARAQRPSIVPKLLLPFAASRAASRPLW